MRRAALSYDTLLADVYWIRALQHYGGERQKPGRERRYDLLYPLLDLATTLDPRFTVGYRFGAIFLAEPHPGGAGRPDQAIALLKKGVAFNPDKWDYYHDIGFIYYWNLHDYQNAADWFGRGGRSARRAVLAEDVRGGHVDARRRSSGVAGRCGRRSARAKRASGCGRRRSFGSAQLDALDQIDVLKRIVDDFTTRTGQRGRIVGAAGAAGSRARGADRSGGHAVHARRSNRRDRRGAGLAAVAAADRTCGCARDEARRAAGAAMSARVGHSRRRCSGLRSAAF